jgi:hypothetical protein
MLETYCSIKAAQNATAGVPSGAPLLTLKLLWVNMPITGSGLKVPLCKVKE